MSQTQSHDYRIDRLRLLACFGVVLLHSSAGTGAGADDLALNAFARFSVPVFVLISGYFMLACPVPTGKLIQKSAALFGKLLAWSAIYLLFHHLHSGFTPESIPEYLLTEPVHLWYLYAAIGLYLMTPVLYVFTSSASRAEYRYGLGFCFLLGCCVTTLVRLDLVPALAVILDKSKLPTSLGFVFLYLLGGWFRRFGVEHSRGWLIIGLVSSAVSVMWSLLSDGQELLSFIAPNVVLSAAACFVLYASRPAPAARWEKPLRLAAECSMGIYLVHPMVSTLLTPVMQPLLSMLFPAGAMIVRAIGIFTVSFAVSALLRRIPGGKWLL